MSEIPGLPGGLDLSALLGQAEGSTMPRTGLKAELSSVRINWGAGLNENGNPFYVLQLTNLDRTLVFDIPMEPAYFARVRRSMEDTIKQLDELQEQRKRETG